MQSSTQPRKVIALRILTPLVMAVALAAVPVAAESGFSFSWGKSVQGSGKIVEVQRTVPAFDRITVSDGIHLVLRQNAQQKVMVKADDNIEPLIETRVEGTTLHVKPRPQTSFRARGEILLAIDYTQLNALNLNDAADVELDSVKSSTFQVKVNDGSRLRLGEVNVGELALTVSDGSRATVGNVRGAAVQRYSVADGARLDIDSAGGERLMLSVADGAHASVRTVDVKSFDIKVADGARVDIAGVAQQQNYALADAASVDAEKLRGASAKVRAADGSSLRLGQLQTLDVDVQDGSSVRYTGDPTITRRVRDGSTLRKI